MAAATAGLAGLGRSISANAAAIAASANARLQSARAALSNLSLPAMGFVNPRNVAIAGGAVGLAAIAFVALSVAPTKTAAIPPAPPQPVATVSLLQPVPDQDQDFFTVPPAAKADSQMQPGAPTDRLDMVLRVDKGDTLVKILTDVGIPSPQASGAVQAMSGVYNPRRLQVGQTLTVTVQPADSGSSAQLLQIALRPEAERDVTVKRGTDGNYSAGEVKYPLTTQRVRYGVRIDESLFANGVGAGVPIPVLTDVIRAFSYDVDFQRDIQPGDTFEVVCERLYTSDGRIAREGRVLYAELVLRGKKLAFYRYKPDGNDEDYYGLDGQSIIKALLRTPIDGAKITSSFGMRGHPILGFTRMHAGVDFGAPAGTPIFAAGNGTIEFVGQKGGYGNFVMIRHSATFETAYGHMTGFARGTAPGVRVRQGDIIGYVGMTGMATGPHLHYEVRKNGTPINPVEFSMPVGPKLAGRELQKFRDYTAAFDRNRNAMPFGPPTSQLLVDNGKR
jgi:murein DD-endopeptidase MepM/ murein hydrolase activator NlpD